MTNSSWRFVVDIAPYILSIVFFVLAMRSTVVADQHHNEIMAVSWMIVGSINSIHYKLQKNS